MHDRLCGHLSSHGWPCGFGNKISLLSRFGGWVLDVWIVLNFYFSITLKKKDWSFYWYFLWECPWSKNSTQSVKHISNNFIQDFCLLKAAIMDMERKLSNSIFDWYRFHRGWTSLRPTENCLQQAVFAAYALSGTEIGVNFHILFQSVINITTQLGRRDHEAFLNSNFYWDWITNTQEIRQWKSLKLDQLN